MLLKVTDKDLKEEPFVFTAGYCELQELLQYEDKIAYARGLNGWRYDLYKIQNVYITTGYSRPRGCKMRIPPELKEEYKTKLREARQGNREKGIKADIGEYEKLLFEFAQKLRNWAIDNKFKN